MVKIYEVGGKVRDSFLGRQNKDSDFAVEAKSYDEMRDYIKINGGKIYLETPEYLTIRAKMPNLGDADFVLCRKDGHYSDNRRPDSVEPGTIFDDLARRDFTMNAIARDVTTGEIIDPHNGQFDIEHKIIRAVGNTEDRIKEDPLRLLRAIRFSITLGFIMDENIENMLTCYHGLMVSQTVSKDRIKDELNKMFRANTPMTLMRVERHASFLISLFSETNLWVKVTNEEK